MNADQIREFEDHGLTCLRGAVDASDAEAMRERIWEEALRRLDMRRDDPSTWQRVPPALVKKPKESEGLFTPILCAAVCDAIDTLLGSGTWKPPALPGQLLMSPPDAEHWILPHKVWHTDFPAPGWAGNELPGIQFFVLLDALGPRQGGTLVVSGSHRLIHGLPERQVNDYTGHSAELRRALARHVPWLRELWSAGPADERRKRFIDQASEHEGVPLRVVEMTGEAGDVFFMHPWALHNAGPNCGERMRIVATERIIASNVRLYTFNRGH